MSNGDTDLDEYFPAGSTASVTIKRKIRDEINQGTLNITDRLITLDDFRTLMEDDRAKTKKEERKRHRISMSVAIIALAVTIWSA